MKMRPNFAIVLWFQIIIHPVSSFVIQHNPSPRVVVVPCSSPVAGRIHATALHVYKNRNIAFVPSRCSRYRQIVPSSWITKYRYLSATINNEYVKASDLEAVQKLFSKYCDTDGLMTKEIAMKVPSISELLADNNLLPEEFDELWVRTPKFPEAASTSETSERIDIDSWVQLYREIDDLFEDDKDDVQKQQTELSSSTVQIANDNNSKPATIGVDETKESEIHLGNEGELSELEDIFNSLCINEQRMISKEIIYQWNEIRELISDGLLGDDEFNELWNKTPKCDSTLQLVDFTGFCSFNAALDALFEIDDTIVEQVSETTSESVQAVPIVESPTSTIRHVVEGDGLDPETLFVALADSNGLAGKSELQSWSELQDMLTSGDLLQSELDTFFNNADKADSDSSKLNIDGFLWLYQSINDIFESDIGDDVEDNVANDEVNLASLKMELLEAIEELDNDDKLPCGLEADDEERKGILAIVDEIENEPGNFVRQKRGAITPVDVAGTWELLYSSSSAMKFNKGLTGLGGSFPNGRFGSLQQTLKASKFMMDVTYVEHIEVKPSTASFDVTVNGSWDLRQSTSLFTGEPSIIMVVEPDRVSYGPTSTRADHWKSLGPMNMLDITYLDDDLRVMRGNTSIENVFIFRRIP